MIAYLASSCLQIVQNQVTFLSQAKKFSTAPMVTKVAHSMWLTARGSTESSVNECVTIYLHTYTDNVQY